jgi:ketosteroid isomerase-like protein
MTPEAGPPDPAARTILTAVQVALDSGDLDVLVDQFTQDAVLIGTASHSATHQEVRRYLGQVLDQGHLKFAWEDVHTLLETDELVALAAFGTATIVSADGESSTPLRLSAVARRTEDGWRIAGWHGSVADGTW